MLLLFVDFNISNNIKLLLTVLIVTLILCFIKSSADKEDNSNLLIENLAVIGRSSYSIYLWHQVLIAFMLYFVVPEQTVASFVIFIFILGCLSFLSYRFIEKHRFSLLEIIIVILLTIGMAVCAFMIYLNAGVVRDVPELGIDKNNVHRGMHAEYCDIPYSWDNDFSTDKVHVLVIGNSYGRDFANSLNESPLSSELEISYIYSPTIDELQEKQKRINDSDFIFYVCGPVYNLPSEDLLAALDFEKLYVVGNKSYGESNGIIYSRRMNDDYLNSSVTVDKKLIQQNRHLKKLFGDRYIDLMELVKTEDLEYRIFTDTGRFISQDCRHLTRDGAIFYGNHLDLSFLWRNN